MIDGENTGSGGNDNFDENNKNINIQPGLNRLGKNQKIAAVILVFLGILFVFLWIAQFKRNIALTTSSGESGSGQGFTLESQEDSDEVLKNKDSDGDGLSDWDELNYYNTSPYLEDSDSDGINDKKEIEIGDDPNCPAGKNCAGLDAFNAGDSTAVPVQNLNNILLPGQADNQLNIPNNSQDNQTPNTSGDELDAKALRALLVGAGMSQSEVDQFTDAELMGEWEKAVGGSGQ